MGDSKSQITFSLTAAAFQEQMSQVYNLGQATRSSVLSKRQQQLMRWNKGKKSKNEDVLMDKKPTNLAERIGIVESIPQLNELDWMLIKKRALERVTICPICRGISIR